MEASFRSRLDRTFGFLNDAKNDGDVSHMWSVEERAASMKNEGLAREGDSDDDEVSGFLDFLKSGMSRRERSDSRFFGEEDLEELESGDEEEDDGGVDGDGDGEEDEEDDGDGDEEEQMRLGKKKKMKGRGEQTEVELVIRASDGDGPLEPSKDDDEEREVREMVGMDCTLDFEDEEDEYDKVAVGVDGLHDRLFMSQITDFGASRRQLDPLPTSFIELRQASRDRRANHKAALARLEEDDRESATRAAKESLQATEKLKIGEITEDRAVRPDHGGEAMDVDDGGHKEEPRQQLKTEIPNLESSLVREGDPAKRRKSGKRVRFSVDDAPMTCTPHIVSDLVPSTTSIISNVRSTPNRYSKVPDYVKNPSKYIHYTLDWSDEDEEQANMAAFHAARVASSPSLLSSSTQDMVTEEESQGPSGSTKISFNPLVKRSSKESGKGLGKGMCTEAVLSNRVVNVAANFDMDSNLGDLITMEDDSTSSGLIGQGKSSRVVRRYRNRVTDDIETD